MKTTLLAVTLIVSSGTASAHGIDWVGCKQLEEIRPGITDTLKTCQLLFEDASAIRAWVKRMNAAANISYEEQEQNRRIGRDFVLGTDTAHLKNK